MTNKSLEFRLVAEDGRIVGFADTEHEAFEMAKEIIAHSRTQLTLKVQKWNTVYEVKPSDDASCIIVQGVNSEAAFPYRGELKGEGV